MSSEDSFIHSSRGFRMYVDPDDARAEALRQADGALNPGSSRLWDTVLGQRAWDVVVDIGANYGEMLLGAALPADARVIAFEPNPQVLPHLRRSIRESGLDVDLREVALGAAEAEATFVMDRVWSGCSGLASSHRSDVEHTLEEVVVAVRTLDSELELASDDSVCMKLDVEGGEFDVLEGARALLTSGRPWAITLEILHMDGFETAQLAADFTMRVMDGRTGDLVVVPPVSGHRLAELLGAGWLYPQDAVITPREAA